MSEAVSAPPPATAEGDDDDEGEAAGAGDKKKKKKKKGKKEEEPAPAPAAKKKGATGISALKAMMEEKKRLEEEARKREEEERKRIEEEERRAEEEARKKEEEKQRKKEKEKVCQLDFAHLDTSPNYLSLNAGEARVGQEGRPSPHQEAEGGAARSRATQASSARVRRPDRGFAAAIW